METRGQIYAPDALLPRKQPLVPNGYDIWWDHRAGLDMVTKRKIPSYTRNHALRFNSITQMLQMQPYIFPAFVLFAVDKKVYSFLEE
jgi:hypothetical protein